MARAKSTRVRAGAASAIRGRAYVRQPFDYSKAEWDEIEACIVTVRNMPLMEIERASLLRAALKYGREAEERKNGDYLPPNVRAKSWTKVARLCAQLCEALETAGQNRSGDNWRSEAIVIVPKELCLTLVRKILGEHVNPPEFWSGRILSIDDLIGLLNTLGKDAETTAEPFYWGVSRLVSFTGRLDPQIVYFQHILWLWTDIFTGKPKLSRDPGSGQLRGPLARYFLAVTGPVMTDEAPSLESLPDIVDRQKSFYRWLDAYLIGASETLKCDRASLAAGRLLGKPSDPLVQLSES